MDPTASPSIWFIVVTTISGLVTLWINSKVIELKKANAACEEKAKVAFLRADAAELRVTQVENKRVELAIQNANQEGRIAALERLVPVIQPVVPAVPPKG